MPIDGGRLLAGVGEDGHVEVELGVRPEGQEEEDGALDSGTEVQNMEGTHPYLGVLAHILGRQAGQMWRCSETANRYRSTRTASSHSG
jgi:hypothetical protein